jgi:hypothetical protein
MHLYCAQEYERAFDVKLYCLNPLPFLGRDVVGGGGVEGGNSFSFRISSRSFAFALCTSVLCV